MCKIQYSYQERSVSRKNVWYIKLLPKPVGKTAKTSFPASRSLTAISCSGFKLKERPDAT